MGRKNTTVNINESTKIIMHSGGTAVFAGRSISDITFIEIFNGYKPRGKATVTLGGSTYIYLGEKNENYNNSCGLVARYDGLINVNDLLLDSYTEGAYGIFTDESKNNLGIPTIKVTGNTSINMNDKQDAFAIRAKSGIVEINNTGENDINVQINGDIYLEKESYNAPIPSISTKFMNDKSFLRGTVTREQDAQGNLALTFANGATWNMTGNSDLSNLTINNGIININYNSTDNKHILKIDNLSGNGTFNINTDIDEDKTDQIIVKNGSGNYKIHVTPTGKSATKEYMDNFIVQQNSGDATYVLANADGHVDQGLYFYTLEKRNEQNGEEWYLKRSTAGRTPETPTGETEASLSGLAGHYAMWYGQLTDLRKRMGEVRYGSQTGLWVRGFADKTRLDGFAGAGFTQNLVGGSIGYDCLVSSTENSKILAGMQIRSGHADQDVIGRWGGYGNLNSVGGGLYTTWLHTEGWYLDGVATADWYEHELRTSMTDGTRVNDDRSSYGLGLSLEAGRRIDFATSNNGQDSWFVDPHMEIAYFWVKGGNFSTSNGMTIDQSNMDSLTARVGILLGKKFTLDRAEHYVQPYIKTGVVHEFLGDQNVYFNDEHFSSDLNGTRVYYGLGVDWQATDNMRLYMQAEREHGEHFTREYNISAGFKFSF